jgi:glycosyltransferase involved in cell wall biosynthesis
VKILLAGDYPSDPRLGSTKVYVKLQQELQALGHECDVLLGEDIGGWPRSGRLRGAVGPVRAAAAIRRAVARGGHNVVDVASAEGAVYARLRRLLDRRPAVVGRSHGSEHLNYARTIADHHHGLAAKPPWRRIYHPLVRLSQVSWAVRGVDRMLVTTQGERNFLVDRGWIARDRVDVVPHGVSAALIRSQFSMASGTGASLLFCGTWTLMKGTPYLAQAFVQLRQSGRDVRLTVLGPGVPAEAVLADFPEAVRHAVSVVPRADESAVMAAYDAHDVLVAPSSFEGFGMVVPEAMARGLPVVATAAGCVPDIIVPGSTGLVVQPRDANGLAREIGRMLDDRPAAETMARAAWQRVRNMTWQSTAEQTVRAYERAIGGQRRGVHRTASGAGRPGGGE